MVRGSAAPAVSTFQVVRGSPQSKARVPVVTRKQFSRCDSWHHEPGRRHLNNEIEGCAALAAAVLTRRKFRLACRRQVACSATLVADTSLDLPSCDSDARIDVSKEWRPLQPSGSIWNRLSFGWVRQLLRRAHASKVLAIEDVGLPQVGLRAAALQAALAEGLAEAYCHKSRASKDEWPLMMLLWRLNRSRFLRTGVLRFLNTVVQFLPVLCLSGLLLAVEQGLVVEGLKSAGFLFCALSTKTIIESQYFYHRTVLAIRIRATLQAAIYEKSLRLPESAAGVPPVTLMQVDTGRVESFALCVHTLWDGIFQVCGYSALLLRYLGFSGLTGLTLLIALLPVNAALNRHLSRLNRNVLSATDARVSKTSEVLGGIRAIRQMGWESIFEREVRALREEELHAMRRKSHVSATLFSMFSALPPFMTALVLFAYAAGGGSFQPSIVFAALSLLNQIRFPLLFYPIALDAMAEGRAALRRITTFLTLEDIRLSTLTPHDAKADTMSNDLSIPAGRFPVSQGGSPVLVLPEALHIRRGELVAIVGSVGSGKSSLIRALLGELPWTGIPVPSGRVAYCAQRPWIPSGSLKDIVSGGVPFKNDIFSEACEIAAVDFAGPHDEISAGTLSGGQQARTALARAIYHARVNSLEDECICVFDDVTAALDPRAAAFVTERCLFGPLVQRTRVVVTNDTGPLLQRCDRVVVMHSDNNELFVSSVGGYHELVERGVLEASQTDMQSFTNSASNGAISEDVLQDDTSDSSAVQVTIKEERATGVVPASLYKRYLASANSPLLLCLSLASVVAAYAADVAQQWFVGIWTADTSIQRGLTFYLTGVGVLGSTAAMLTFTRALLINTFGRRASRTVHGDMCKSVLVRATTRYFDANPLGRVLQRFGKDLEQIDNALPGSIRAALACSCTLAGAMFTITLASPSFFFLLVPLLFIYIRAMQYYRPVARDLKRLEALARSPVYAEQANAAEGVATIRQLRVSDNMTNRCFRAIDGNTAVTFSLSMVDRWFAFRMELLGNFIVFTTAAFGIVTAANMGSSPWATARAAVSVTQALSVVGLLNWTVRTITDTETSFNSFQRVVYTTDATESEAARELPGDSELGKHWPEHGQVTFSGVHLRYREDLPSVLNGVELTLQPGRRVAVVGRTGSGKSTLLRILLRIVEVNAGCVSIDGVDIRNVGLSQLRSAVTVIPQENFLLTGSVRRNVDPQGRYSDEQVRFALQAASLGHWPLDQQISAAGGGISPGERQLLGVARAMVRQSKVIALDEVTSRVDEATDREVQQALWQLPKGTTLLVVSHRLQTLLDYDSVVVMDKGQVAEVGSPKDLQARPNSFFAQLLAAELSGSDEAAIAQPLAA